MKTTTTVFLADDHAFLCELLARHLDAVIGVTVVGMAYDADAAVRAVRRLRPDVVVVDIDMPGRSVFDAIRQTRHELPETRFLILSAHVTDHYVQQALELEVHGYLKKTHTFRDISEAIRRVAVSQVFYSPEVWQRISIAPDEPAHLPLHSRLASLTRREQEVLCYVARGLAKKQMADVMHISVKTVDQHCTNLMAKLEIHDRVELTRFAIREGLVNT